MNEHVESVVRDLCLHRNYKTFALDITSKIGKGENYTGDIERGRITGVYEDGQEETLDVIIKTPNETARENFPVNVYYVRELFTYDSFLPYLEMQQQKFCAKDDRILKFAELYGGCAEEIKEVLIFKDVSCDGFQMYDRLKSLDYDHLMLAIKTLATFHAHSFAAKHSNPELYAEAIAKSFGRNDFGESFGKGYEAWKDRAVNAISDDRNRKKLEEFCGDDIVFEKLLDMYDLGASQKYPHNIICHGDCWINNFLYKYKDEKPVKMVLIDWQMNNYSSPVTDLSYLLYSSTDEDVRTRHWPEIFDTYYATLESRLNQMGFMASEIYPRDVYEQQIDEKLAFGLIWSFMTVPIVLGKKEDAMDLSDLIGDDSTKENRPYSKEIIERLNGVVRDFVKLNYI